MLVGCWGGRRESGEFRDFERILTVPLHTLGSRRTGASEFRTRVTVAVESVIRYSVQAAGEVATVRQELQDKACNWLFGYVQLNGS